MAYNTVTLPRWWNVSPSMAPHMSKPCIRCYGGRSNIYSATGVCEWCRGDAQIGQLTPPGRKGMRKRFIFNDEGKVDKIEIPDENGYPISVE